MSLIDLFFNSHSPERERIARNMKKKEQFSAVETVLIDKEIAYIRKTNPRLAWPNHNCSNKRLLEYLKVNREIDHIQYIDDRGLADGIEIYFK